MFWGKYSEETDTSLEQWQNRQVELTELGKLTMQSHARIGNKVILYSYQKIATRLPENVEIKNAEGFYPAKIAYEDLKRGQRICYLADLIRLLHVGKYTGVIIDLDTVVLRKFPEIGFIGSMPAKMTGGFAPQWGKAHPPLKVIDDSWDGKALIDFPVSVDKEMKPYMQKIATIITQKLWGDVIKGFDGWNAICRELEKIPVKVLPPFYTCPIPAWKNRGGCYSLESPTRFDGTTHLYGHRMPSVEEILEGSLAVQHFFESAFKGEYRTEKGFWNTIKDDCLLAREAQYILGENWRTILDE